MSLALMSRMTTPVVNHQWTGIHNALWLLLRGALNQSPAAAGTNPEIVIQLAAAQRISQRIRRIQADHLR